MQIKMIKTAMGSECGKITKEFIKGETYEISDRLGNVFVNQMKVAEMLGGEKMKEQHDNKSLGSDDYQNKSEKPKGKKKES